MRPFGPFCGDQQVSELSPQRVETLLCIGQWTLGRFPYLTKMAALVQPLPMLSALALCESSQDAPVVPLEVFVDLVIFRCRKNAAG